MIHYHRHTSLPTILLLALLLPVSSTSAQMVNLFDGVSLRCFQSPDGNPVNLGWQVDDGVIHLASRDGPRAGNIVTRCNFTDFRLTFDWKISPGGNSGIKYRVRNYKGRMLGCEYQMLDDEHFSMPTNSRTSSGSLYGLYEPNDKKSLLPVGEFNTGQIVVRGSQLEHWLNGKRILVAKVGSLDWFDRVSNSKFDEYPGFSQNRRGRIMLTDHSSEVWFRNIRLESLPTVVYCASRRCR